MPPVKSKALPKTDSKEVLSIAELKLKVRSLKKQIAILTREINDLLEQGVSEDLRPEMQALHEYNDIKDTTQMVLGRLAQAQGCTVTELHKKYNLAFE
ncbi:hypothetical protein ABEB36_003467 [Hypothenemus hampei]|uniref:DNA repair protein SWI5 homolog n=1 Tax=Hypothenemus hampei TaxID=57062 RepID=A0ABD1FCE1_HYPHA